MTFRNSLPITKTAARFCNFHYTTKASSIQIVPLHRSSAVAEKPLKAKKKFLAIIFGH